MYTYTLGKPPCLQVAPKHTRHWLTYCSIGLRTLSMWESPAKVMSSVRLSWEYPPRLSPSSTTGWISPDSLSEWEGGYYWHTLHNYLRPSIGKFDTDWGYQHLLIEICVLASAPEVELKQIVVTFLDSIPWLGDTVTVHIEEEGRHYLVHVI